jgi:hypothetical protein
MKKIILIIALFVLHGMSYASSREQIVATSSSAVQFTKITIAERMICIIKNGANEVFADWIGSTPTTTIGIPLQAYDTLTVTPYEFNNFKAIASGTTSTIYGMCSN